MTTSTVDRDPKHSLGQVGKYKVGVDIIYGGCAVAIDVSSSGFLFDFNAAAADLVFRGIAMEYVDNSGGSAGDKSVNVWHEGEFEFDIASTDQTAVGMPCWLIDNKTVSLTPGQYGTYCGVIRALVSATKVRVAIDTGAARDASGLIPANGTAPLRVVTGKGAFTTTGTSVAVSAGGLTVITGASLVPVIDAGAAAANGQLSLTEDASTGNPEVSGGNVTVVRIAGTDSGLKFVYTLWGY